jgi:hypothetical protein
MYEIPPHEKVLKKIIKELIIEKFETNRRFAKHVVWREEQVKRLVNPDMYIRSITYEKAVKALGIDINNYVIKE